MSPLQKGHTYSIDELSLSVFSHISRCFASCNSYLLISILLYIYIAIPKSLYNFITLSPSLSLSLSIYIYIYNLYIYIYICVCVCVCVCMCVRKNPENQITFVSRVMVSGVNMFKWNLISFMAAFVHAVF